MQYKLVTPDTPDQPEEPPVEIKVSVMAGEVLIRVNDALAMWFSPDGELVIDREDLAKHGITPRWFNT